MSNPQEFERFERAFDRYSIDKIWELRRAIVGPANMPAGAQADLAKEALAALKKGGTPSPKQIAALELTIRMMRPSLLSINRSIEDLPPEASGISSWDEFRTKVRRSLYTIGRVDNSEGNGIGSGFLVSEKVLVTNAHVVDQLSNGTRVLERGQASVRFKREYQTVPDDPAVAVVKVIAVHETLDLALLEVDSVELNEDRVLLQLEDGDSQEKGIVVIGYPQNDSSRNPLFISSIFENRFGVKRAAPGEVIDAKPNALFHDCSTLGGNSGSPVISLATCRVIGVHRSGDFLFRNEAVSGGGLLPFVEVHRA